MLARDQFFQILALPLSKPVRENGILIFFMAVFILDIRIYDQEPGENDFLPGSTEEIVMHFFRFDLNSFGLINRICHL